MQASEPSSSGERGRNLGPISRPWLSPATKDTMKFMSAERLAQLPIKVIENNAGTGVFRFRLNGLDETVTILVQPNLSGNKFIPFCSHHIAEETRKGVQRGNRDAFGSIQTAFAHALAGLLEPYHRAVAQGLVPEARWLVKNPTPLS